MACMHVQINDRDGINVVIRVPGPYSPDVLDDAKARARDLYQEVIAYQIVMSERQGEAGQ